MTPEQAATAAEASVRYLGTAFAADARNLRRAREHGLPGWAFLVAGAGAPLGDIAPEALASAVGFASPAVVAAARSAVRRARPIEEIEGLYIAACRRWGAEKLDGYGATVRLADLSARIVDTVDATGMPLFAAWRARTGGLAAADGSRGARVSVLAHLLWQHRAGALLLAARVAGLAGLPEATGDAGGDSQPAEPEDVQAGRLSGLQVRRRVLAEALAVRIAGQAYAALDAGERAEFVALVVGARDLAALPTGELPQVRASERARTYLQAHRSLLD